MKKILHVIFCCILLMGTFSCKKYLDLTPKGQLILTKTSDYRLLLNQTTPNGKSNGFFLTYSLDAMLDDDLSAEPYSSSYYSASDFNAFNFAENIYLENQSDIDWEAMYNQIYVANLVINDIGAATGPEQDKQELLAEARVQRAFAYFTLVNLYAKQYNPATAATDLGVPIRVETDFTEKLNRQTVQKVYDYIINELTLAVPYLANVPVPATDFRPVKPAALTLLARTSLFMNNPQAAFKYADSSLRCYSTLIDYNNLVHSPSFAELLIAPAHFANPEVLMDKTTNNGYLTYASPALIALYDTTNDRRFHTYFIDDVLYGLNGDGYISREIGNAFKGPSVPETYLIRAESSARMGNAAAAMTDINLLRKFRYRTGTNYTLTATTAADALSMVKDERRRELAFCGSRYFDIKRYNVFDNANITITHKWNGTFTLAPNSPRVVLPIGRKYIDLNPEIIQNPR